MKNDEDRSEQVCSHVRLYIGIEVVRYISWNMCRDCVSHKTCVEIIQYIQWNMCRGYTIYLLNVSRLHSVSHEMCRDCTVYPLKYMCGLCMKYMCKLWSLSHKWSVQLVEWTSWTMCASFKTLRPSQYGWHFADFIYQCLFWMRIVIFWFASHRSLGPSIQLAINLHCFM